MDVVKLDVIVYAICAGVLQQEHFVKGTDSGGTLISCLSSNAGIVV